jgi:hypothetical protein
VQLVKTQCRTDERHDRQVETAVRSTKRLGLESLSSYAQFAVSSQTGAEAVEHGTDAIEEGFAGVHV